MSRLTIEAIMEKGITLIPRSGKSTATVIFSHGLGDTAHGWADVMEDFQQSHDHIKFVLPTAPVQPVTLNGGYKMTSWYDIKSLSERGDEDKQDLDRAKSRIDALIEDEIAKGTPANRIMIAGFSQGSALSIYTCYQSKHKLAGCMVLSGYVPLAHKFVDLIAPETKPVPLMMFHGEADPVVVFQYGKKSFDVLKEAGVNGRFTSFKNLGHSANLEEIQLMDKFIKEVLPKI